MSIPYPRTPDPDEDFAWFKSAKCRGMPPSLFVPDERGGNRDKAKAICYGTLDGVECPVRLDCLDYGERYNLIGIWGGKMRSSKPRRKSVEIDAVSLTFPDARPRRN